MISHHLKNPSRSFLTGFDNLFCYLFDKSPKRGPLFVNWDITTKCNSKCVFCDRWKIGGKELSTKDKLHIIRELGKSGVWFLSLCGGEPLLTKDLDIILKEIKKQKMLVNISTNGFLLKKKSKLLLDSEVDFITVSIQSHNPSIHNSISGQKDMFQKINAGIDSIKKIEKTKRPKIYGRVVFNNLTLQHLNEFLEYWRPRLDEIILQPILDNTKMFFKIPKHMKFSKKDKKRFDNFNNLLKIHKSYNSYNKMVPKYIFEKERLKKEIKCFACYFFLTLDAEGNVYSCSSRNRKIGNLRKESLSSILNSNDIKDFRRMIKHRKNKCVCWHSGSMLNVYLSKIL